MNNAEPKIRFYSIDGKLLENLDFDYNNLDDDKNIKISKRFNKALKIVIHKDIRFLSNKLSKIVKDITKKLSSNGITIEKKIDDKIENIELVINDIEALISGLIIDKNNIKVGIFSSNKKEKRKKIEKLEDSINYLSRCQNDIISIRDEYIKLDERNKGLEDLYQEDDEEDSLNSDDNPLERTVNFYMAKEN